MASLLAPLGRGVVAGLVAGLVLTTLQGLARLLLDVSPPAELVGDRIPPGTRLSWALWSYDWRPAGPGPATLVGSRATDGDGGSQIAEERGVVPMAATGYHKVDETVV
ncbi:MAG: hypothetical protein LH603_09785 [Pseudonocardia sp.]|nr:hypothetical protein [Pseudonocardia sp.]